MKKIFCVILVFASLSATCQIRLPRLVSDNAVFQHGKELNIFGWSSSDEDIKLAFNGKTFSAKANDKGEWKIKLPAQKAGGPFEMVFTGKNQVTLRNILFGDVWLCSGQSNMELTMDRLRDKYRKEVAASANKFIRHFEVPDKYDFKSASQDVSGGAWKEANPSDVLNFSAVAYFFADEIYEKHKVPIGLVNAALGGSPVESWMSEEVLKKFPAHLDEAFRFRSDSLIQSIESADRKRMNDWYSDLAKKDVGVAQRWKSANVDASSWSEMNVPGYWADGPTGNVNGSVWFTRTFKISEVMVGKQARLQLGRIVDQDSVFVNGQFVGTTSYQYPPRRYEIKPGILKAGENRITVRVINQSGRGGFVLDKPYFISVDGDTLDLKGAWKFKVDATMNPLPGQTFIRWKPLGLYNAMIAPLTKFPIRGVIWYQGEANTGAPEEYATLFPAMIGDWRKQWNENFPFLFVQLANFMEAKENPTESNWARLRESQRTTVHVANNTGMAVAIDLGEWNDIHPFNKKDVGHRLALLARKIAYGEKNLIAASPEPYNYSFQSKEVIIQFRNAAAGLTVKNGGELKQFSISDDGKKFVWAKARIEKDTVIVWSDEIVKPRVVRYAWADNPDSANLYNREGLPATPFEVRSDK
jgi:sialate O-acetylesterase